MLHRTGTRARGALAVGLLLLVAAACSSTPVATPTPAPPLIIREPATFIGPVVSTQETATQSLGRDGGLSVPLPNGKVFWIWGDTPTYKFEADKAWHLRGFIQGSSAGIGDYTPGEAPEKPLNEVAVGQPPTAQTVATQFLPPPQVYVPNTGGKACTKENAGDQAGAVRWASGAVLMPDKTNIFVPYISACVITATEHSAEGWGFAMYNWKTNKFSVPPTEVFVPKKDGSALTTAQYFGSPVLTGDQITMYSSTCCEAGSAIFSTTIPATVKALKNQDSYQPSPVLGVPATFMLHVARTSPTEVMMYQLSGNQGEYRIFTASNAAGPFAMHAEGQLPKCDTSPQPCNNSIYLHPEFSTPKSTVVSYWVPGYGPADSTHPDPTNQIWKVVMASLPN
jgi:hypothetical protein